MRKEGERNVDLEGEERVDARQEGREKQEQEEEEEEEEEDTKSVMEDLVASYFTNMSRRGSPLVSGAKHFAQSPARSFSSRHHFRPGSNGHSNGGSAVNSNMHSYINSVMNSNINSVMNSNINSVMNSNMNSNMNSVMNSNINSVMNSNMNSNMNSVMNSNINSATNSQEYGIAGVAADSRWAKQSIDLSKSSTPRPNSPFQHIQLPSPYTRMGTGTGTGTGIGSDWDSQLSPSLAQLGSTHVVAFSQPESSTFKISTSSAAPCPLPLPFSHAPFSIIPPFQTEKWSPMVQLSLSPMPVSLFSLCHILTFKCPSFLILLDPPSLPPSLPLHYLKEAATSSVIYS